MKYALGFLSGSIFIAAIVVTSAGHPAVMFMLGAFMMLAAILTSLYFAGLSRTARFLIAFQQALEQTRTQKQVAMTGASESRNALEPPSKEKEILRADLESALINQGAKRAEAKRAAEEAARHHDNFESAFRAGIAMVARV